MVHLHLIFQRIREAYLCVNLEKCHFSKRQLAFFGHLITQEWLIRLQEKFRAIVDFPAPRNIKEVLRFLGMCVWYSCQTFQVFQLYFTNYLARK